MNSRETTKDTGLQMKLRNGSNMDVRAADVTQTAPALPQRTCASEQASEFILENRPLGFTPLSLPVSLQGQMCG